jgi:hypothetical protein
MWGTNKHRYAGFPAILSDAQRVRHGGNAQARCNPGPDVAGYSRLAGTDEDRPHSNSVLQIAASAANLSFTKAPGESRFM